jgi:hypothetical protein
MTKNESGVISFLLSFIFTSFYFVCLSFHLPVLHLYVKPFVNQFLCLSIHLSLCLPVHLSVSMCVCSFICLYTCLSVHLSTSLYDICMLVYLFICFSAFYLSFFSLSLNKNEFPPSRVSTSSPAECNKCSKEHFQKVIQCKN